MEPITRFIYELLLICDDDVELPSDGLGDKERQLRTIRGVPLYPQPRPAVAILQTCRLANEEGVPMLWGKNRFAICLSVDLTEPFFLHKVRWTTIQHITSLKFTSNTMPLTELRRSDTAPHFTCSGADILARYTSTDVLYSPFGPDVCMSLSIRSWVSTNVTRAELNAIQQELEAIMANDNDNDVLLNAPDDADAQT